MMQSSFFFGLRGSGLARWWLTATLAAGCAAKPPVQDAPLPAGAADAAAGTADAAAGGRTAGFAPRNGAGEAKDQAGPDQCKDSKPGPPPPPPHNPLEYVRNFHQTWQRDPSTTVTLTWTTNVTDLAAYTPRALYAPASEVCSDGRRLFAGQALQATGSGLQYDTITWDGQQKAVTWTVELTGLTPDTDYAFAVGTWQSHDPATGHFAKATLSQPGRFRTAPAKGSRAPMRFVMAGDSRGGTANIYTHSKRFAAIPALAWFFTGDMSSTGVQPQWDDWFESMGPILWTKPLMPVQGNHEMLAEIHYGQFALPVAPGLSADYLEHAWALDIGNVHMIGLDSNTDEGIADQVPWLTKHLEAAAKNPDTDWTFVMMHHPAYSASTVHGSSTAVQKHWVPLFEKYGVDVAFAGHDHCYERSVPITAGKPAAAATGVTYVVAGGFFAPPYKNGSDWWTAVSHHGNKYNYVEISVNGKALTLTAWSGDGAEKLDQVQITR